MHITLSPQRSGAVLAIERTGETLSFNGESVDFSGVGEEPVSGPDLSSFLVGPVSRVEGQLHLTVILPLAEDAGEAARFPSPIVDPPDGPIALPT